METNEDKQQEVFKPIGASVKAAVIMSGEAVLKDNVLLASLSEKQLASLQAITRDPKHPWMVEHNLRVEDLSLELQREFRAGLDREKRLKRATDKVFWSRKRPWEKVSAALQAGFQKILFFGVGVAGLLFFFGIIINGF